MPAATTQEVFSKYLDPKVLAKIQRLDIKTRLIVEGFISGLHRSPFLGLSVEFAQHREYAPGDEIKHVDWKVFSRTDRFFIKQYQEETNLNATFLVDCSESMAYRGPERMSKFEYAACAAGSLAHLLLRQQDGVGLVTFDEEIRGVLPPSAHPHQVKTLLHLLDQASAVLRAKTSFEAICQKMAAKLHRRGLICLFSDLFGEADSVLRGLTLLASRGHDVLVFHVMDEDELTFPFEGNIRFKGLEEAGLLLVQAHFLRQGYLDSLKTFLTQIQGGCASRRIHYKTVDSSRPLGAVLAEFLTVRDEAAHRAAGKRR